MFIDEKGRKFRNLPEQVAKNKRDIEDFQGKIEELETKKQDKVEVNPVGEEGTFALQRIKIDGIVYFIQGGGGESDALYDAKYFQGGRFEFYKYNSPVPISLDISKDFYNRREIDALLQSYTLYSDFAQLQSDFDNVKETVTHNVDRLDAIENRLTPIESDVTNLRTDVNLHDSKINGLQTDVTDLKNNVANVQPVIITTVQQTTVDGYIVPDLTVEQVTNLYNALVAGRKATVDFTTSGVHQQLDFVNATNLTGLSVRCVYQDVMVLTYTISGDSVSITYKEIGGSGDKYYRHRIDITGTAKLGSTLYDLHIVTEEINKSPNNISDIQDLRSGFILCNGLLSFSGSYYTVVLVDNNVDLTLHIYFMDGTIQKGASSQNLTLNDTVTEIN